MPMPRTRKRTFSVAKLSLLGATFLLSGTVGTWAQPAATEKPKTFIESGKLYTVDSGNSLKVIPLSEKTLATPTVLYPLRGSNGETSSFVLVGESQAALLSPGGEVTPIPVPEPGPLQSAVVGNGVLLFQEASPHLIFVSADGKHTTLETPGRTASPVLLGARGAVALGAPGEYYLFETSDPTTVKKLKHPFGGEVQVSVSGDQAILWSKEKLEVVLAGFSTPIALNHRPTQGVKPLESAQWALVGDEQLAYLRYPGHALYFSIPNALKQIENLEAVQAFVSGKSLQILIQDARFGVIATEFSFSGKTGGKVFTNNTLRHVIPSDKEKGGHEFLFTETSFEERKVDDDGNPVMILDLKATKKQPLLQSVKGYTAFNLDPIRGWKPLLREERGQLVGPCQIVGEHLIFAVQHEPPNHPGIGRSIDQRYPYPRVVLKAIDIKDGREAWALELPRGEAPSASRLPETAWPLSKAGHLLFTTEDNRLSALDPRQGKIVWSSADLPLDESRPAILEWGSSLGLIATDKTVKKLILLDQSNGKILAENSLSGYFNSQRTANLVGVSVICISLLAYIYLAGRRKLFIRRIAGLEALDEAVGRATEMGKPVLYVTGLADVDDTQTLASLSILSHVAKKTAEYDTSILTTTSRAVTFSAAQEVVRDAFTIAGRPDSFSVESVQYISDDQFGYAAGVDGLMVREEPAANFYMGKFFAESLIFAETGHATGAIQIAGTAQANQLPFFVAACDYTLIGEELFAASAYLSGDPLQVGSLRGQDVGKAIVMIILVVASLDLSFGGHITKFLGEMFL